jgi:hypothetical protein
MSLDQAQFVGLLRGVTDESPQRREEHAEVVADLRNAASEAQLHAIASVLAAVAVWEPDGNAREAQLHTLAELHEWDATTPDVLDLVRPLDRTTLTGSEVEYVGYLLDR